MATPRKSTKQAAAKKAAKKAPTKQTTKVAKRRTKTVDLTAPLDTEKPFVKPLIMASNLDLFSEDDPSVDLVTSMREGLDGVSQRAKTKQVSFLSPEQMAKVIIPLDELTLQNAIGAVGLRSATLFELIAPEHVGKTTLLANWLGKFAIQGCQGLYIECEGKQMDPNRFLRCMHTDRKVAERVFKLVTFTKARTLPQAEHNMNVWVKEARKRSDADPRFAGKPLIVVVDPWGKLMSEGEAEGYSTFGKSAQQLAAAKVKETGKSSNLGHAKYAHAWTRRLPTWLEESNVIVFIVQHQNEHIDMGSYSPVMVSDAKNDTAIGGKAFAQLAAYRATLTNSGQWYGTNKASIGLKTRLMFIKNSYGPKFRTLDLRLKFEQHSDTATHFDPVTYYSYGLADWMAENGILGARVTDKLFTCDTLGCVAVTADELHAAIKQRPDVVQFIGTQLKIEGYAHVPMRTVPIEEVDEEEDDKSDGSSARQDMPESVKQAMEATEHLMHASPLSDLPPPPPMTLSDPPPPPQALPGAGSDDDYDGSSDDTSIGGFSSMEDDEEPGAIGGFRD
jgi:RecA/RadA recombinase